MREGVERPCVLGWLVGVGLIWLLVVLQLRGRRACCSVCWVRPTWVLQVRRFVGRVSPARVSGMWCVHFGRSWVSVLW